MKLLRIGLIGAWLASAAAAFAVGTLTVTSPIDGRWLGATNTLSFNGKGGSVQVKVEAVITGPAGSSTVSTNVTPNQDGDFNGTLSLNFSQTAAQGPYVIVVSATEPGNTYEPTTIRVTVDTKAPKLLDYRPAQSSFVKGTVPLFFKLLEDNMKEWRITVNGADIPNNTGTTQTDLSLTYDATTLENDGPQTIALIAKDQADNVFNFSIPVTVDRRPPVTSIQFPRSDTPIRTRSDVNVIVDVTDQFANAVDVTGVDVVIQRTDGTFVTRVSRQSWADAGNNTWRWKGRLRWRAGFPSTYKLVVSVTDKAGNVATRQEVVIRPGA